MKKIASLLLTMLLFCFGCAFENIEYDLPPQLPEISDVSEKGITLTESAAEKTEKVTERFLIQRLEGDRWIFVEPLSDETETAVTYFAEQGKISEYRIDFTEFYGELPKGKYCLTLGLVDSEESGKYRNIGYRKIEFEIE